MDVGDHNYEMIPNHFNVLIILSYINMTNATENQSLSNSRTEVVTAAPGRSITIKEPVHEENTNGSLYITEKPVVEFTEKGDLLNVTKSELRNITEESESEIDDIHSNFNLAIIPAVAVFVFTIIICIKCCKWFRQYTRGGSNDDKFYAVVVTDDDKEYDHVDITSESASTVYYDTVSSYASVLKRSGNDSTLGSIRTWRQGSTKSDTGRSSMSKAVNKSTETIGDLNVRINSTSSAETVSEQLTDSPAFRRNNRFRVSFVTESRPSASEFRTSNDNIKHEKTMRSSLKKSSTVSSPGTTSPSNISGITPKEIKMINVGTQTNKSFRYSIRKLKGHVSDSDIDERLFCRPSAGTLALQSEDSKDRDNCGDILSKTSDRSKTNNSYERHSNVSLGEDWKSSHSKVIRKILKYPFDTNEEVIQDYKQTEESREDSDDDVFIEEIIADSTLHHNKTKCIDVNTSETFNSDRKRCEENVFVGPVQVECSCSYCNSRTCRNFVDPICDKDNLLNLHINPVDKMICAKCTLEYKNEQKDSCGIENDKADELLIEHQCKFPETNERPPSTLSLESSGYAELSSSESSSSSPRMSPRIVSFQTFET